MDTAVLSNDKGVTEAIGWPSKKRHQPAQAECSEDWITVDWDEV